MRYSIIIPIFNCEKYLRRCLDSVLAQTYRDWEMLLIDDGSTDGSSQICDEYSAKNQQIQVIHQTNGGVLHARRVGISVSTGEYLCFLDSDDFWDENLLVDTSLYLEHYNPDILVFGFRRINSKGEILGTYIPVQQPTYLEAHDMKEIQQKVAKGELSNLWVEIIKRSVVDFQTDYSPYFSVFKGEDLLQNIAFIDNAHSVLLIPECYYSYFINEAGLTARKITVPYVQSHVLVQQVLIDYCEKWNIDPQPSHQLFGNVFQKSFKALYRDSWLHPNYKKQERRDLMAYLVSPECNALAQPIVIGFSYPCRLCMFLLRYKKTQLLTIVLNFMHILYMMKKIMKNRNCK